MLIWLAHALELAYFAFSLISGINDGAASLKLCMPPIVIHIRTMLFICWKHYLLVFLEEACVCEHDSFSLLIDKYSAVLWQKEATLENYISHK